jgi:hypothetical protein
MSIQSNLKSFLKAKQTEGREDHGITNESAIRPTCSEVNCKLTTPSPGSCTPFKIPRYRNPEIGELKQAELCNDGTVAELEWGPAPPPPPLARNLS